MADSIHGHDVMHFMLEQGGSFTRDTLKAAIDTRFGADARFHTCSQQDLDAAQLIDVLAAKGKFIEQGEGFNTASAHICQH